LKNGSKVLSAFDPVKKNDDVAKLTPRQMQILRYLGRGKVPKEIASALNLSVATVRTNIQAIHKRLNIHSRVEVIFFCLEKGLN
jgi:two-component system nitrate/nitrite response regulator NarL